VKQALDTAGQAVQLISLKNSSQIGLYPARNMRGVL
jgi:hypothetical protein